MNVEILSIGDELLIGQTINTNASWMGEQLSLNGFRVNKISAISDEKEAILSGLKELSEKAEIILITGGLGPTKDDITKKVLADYFETKLVRNIDVLKHIEAFFTARGRTMLETNIQQADLPENCIVLHNELGTASGMWFEKNGKIFVSMPGVPYEMKHIMEVHVIPRLKEKFNPEIIVHRTIHTQGIGESFIAEKIKDFENELRNDGLSLAYLPSPGIVKLRITASGKGEKELRKKVNDYEQKLLPLIEEWFYGYDKTSLEEVIGKLLSEKKKTISTAESCTGGYISHRITSVPGSSVYFMGSVVCYSNEIKMNQLGVNKETLQKHGAVSQEVVEEMATGARKLMHTDYSIAVSGVAGPDGGSEEKPVGMVWIAVASEEKVISKKFMFEMNRERNIVRAGLSGMMMFRKMLISE
jgi:nicotinamide-nucleotide amidase